jgi:aspartyl/asparaginyl beta-hydroxylase (cupin superfamily)
MAPTPSSTARGGTQVVRCARLDMPVDLPSLQAEAAALPDLWMPHFQTARYDGDWLVLPLRSPGGRQDVALPHALSGEPVEYAGTPLLAQSPAIGRFLAAFECPVMSARLLNLRAGAEIKPHRDVELAFEHGSARLHVPLVTNPGVEFVIDGEPLAMEAGSCWYINANLTHRVANRGDTDRIHLVVDCTVDDWLRERFARAEVAYSQVRRDPRETRQMIELLRAMDTPTARALVASLEDELAGAA